MFTLVLDDFGIRYTNKQDVDNLIAIINKEYKCSQDWTGNRYIGFTLIWNYENTTLISQCPATLSAHCNASFTPRPSALSMPRTITPHQPMAPANNLQPLIGS
jgi:hypothetical protein